MKVFRRSLNLKSTLFSTFIGDSTYTMQALGRGDSTPSDFAWTQNLSLVIMGMYTCVSFKFIWGDNFELCTI